LRGLGEIPDLDQAALRSFLLAEALDQRVGLGAGRRELEEFRRRRGLHPLMALALAERLDEGATRSKALELFEVALGAHDYLGLRGGRKVLERAISCAQEGASEAQLTRWTGELAGLTRGPPETEPMPTRDSPMRGTNHPAESPPTTMLML